MTKESEKIAAAASQSTEILQQTNLPAAPLENSAGSKESTQPLPQESLKGKVISCEELSKADVRVQHVIQREPTVLQKTILPSLPLQSQQNNLQATSPAVKSPQVAILQAAQSSTSAATAEVVPTQAVSTGVKNAEVGRLVTQMLPQTVIGNPMGEPARTIHFPTQIAVPTLSGCGPLPIMRHPNDTSGVTSRSTTVPEFLYQLVKMLAEDNKEVIEWVNGNIMVHNPHKLASHVLGKYFRHSKYASFQRQLNYFGFRKISGKGKMAPCSYVNDEVTTDMRSLLSIKRKPHGATGGRGKTHQSSKERKPEVDHMKVPLGATASPLTNNLNLVNSLSEPQPVQQGGEAMNAITMQPSQPQVPVSGNETNGSLSTCVSSPPSALAQAAVGRGVKHCLNGYLKPGPTDPAVVAETQRQNLLELQKNFQKSSQERKKNEAGSETSETPAVVSSSVGERKVFAGGIREESIASLVDLAMIPQAPISGSGDIVKAESDEKEEVPSSDKLTFIDFPAGEGAWGDAFGWSQSAK